MKMLVDENLYKLMDELEYMPCHYVHHFADALRVVSIYYPVPSCSKADYESYPIAKLAFDEGTFIRTAACKIHSAVAQEIFHFKPETRAEFKARHCDKVDHA